MNVNRRAANYGMLINSYVTDWRLDWAIFINSLPSAVPDRINTFIFVVFVVEARFRGVRFRPLVGGSNLTVIASSGATN